MPVLPLLVGPNGAGKSTYVRELLAQVTHLPFINADAIAAERWPDAQAEHAYEAAQIAEVQRRERMAARESFISETVFSHPSKVALVADAAAAGYLVQLHTIMVPVEVTVQRVIERVRRGGHEVPEQKIRARYERLWDHVASAIRLADVAEVYDNGSARHPFELCATFVHGTPAGPTSWPSWTPSALRHTEHHG